MRNVILVDYDYDTVDQSERTVNSPGILIDEYTMISKDWQELEVYRSKYPIEVAEDGSVITRGICCIGIELNEAGNALDLEELAGMSFAEFSLYMRV